MVGEAQVKAPLDLGAWQADRPLLAVAPRSMYGDVDQLPEAVRFQVYVSRLVQLRERQADAEMAGAAAFVLVTPTEQQALKAAGRKLDRTVHSGQVRLAGRVHFMTYRAQSSVYEEHSLQGQFQDQAHGRYCPASLPMTLDANLSEALKRFSSVQVLSRTMGGGTDKLEESRASFEAFVRDGERIKEGEKRVGKERDHAVPGPAPGSDHGGELLAPGAGLEGVQLGRSGLGAWRRADQLDGCGQRLAVLPAGVVQAATD